MRELVNLIKKLRKYIKKAGKKKFKNQGKLN